MADVDLIIDVSDRDDPELGDFLASQGIRARPHYGVFAGPPPSGSSLPEMLKHPAPYIWATAAGHVLISALRAYLQTKQKRLIIHRLKTGVKVDATNWTPDELKEIGFLDIVKLEPIKKDKSDA
jgi:hypothetical protein